MNHQQLMQEYKKRHFEAPMKIDNRETSMPIPDKIVGWALLSILEVLGAINGHLAASETNRRLGSGS